ncbi:MAG: hypothetical protein V4675_04705 [Verrucomicrobiota bacterium]
MNSRPWCLALLLASGSPLPAQQDPAALLALSHALDSKLGFTSPDLSEWTVVADPGASGGTCLLGTPSNSTSFSLETRVTGPASLRFRAKGSFRYSAKPLDAVYGYTAETALPNNPTWGEYKINLPAGVQSVTWVGQAAPWLGEALLDSVTVAPLDGAAAQAAVDYPGPISFPGYGEWSVDDENSVIGTSSLRQPISPDASMSFPVTGPAVVRYCMNMQQGGTNTGLTITSGTTVLSEDWGLRNYRWLPTAFFVPEGIQTLLFSRPMGVTITKGWVLIDALAVEPAGTGLAEALGHPGPWSVSGAEPWHAQNAMKHSGTSAAAAALHRFAVLSTTISGPSSLSFHTHQLGITGFRLQVDDLDYAVIAAAATDASYDITAPDWLESRIAIPRGDHKISWKANHTATKPFPQLFLLDTVRVQPLPIAEIASALDSTLPWELDGPILPQVQVSNTATGGTLLASPAGRGSASRISLSVRGPGRVRYRLGVGTSSDIVSTVKDGLPFGLLITRTEEVNLPYSSGRVYEKELPAGEFRFTFDLQNKIGAVQLDGVAVLPASGITWIEWAMSLRLMAGGSLSYSDRNLDNDGDKRTNFSEYAFDTSPYMRDSRDDVLTIEPATDQSPATLVLKWNAGRIDAAWAIQESADLKTWTDRWVPGAAEASPGEGNYLTWRKAVPVEGAKRWFRAIVRPVTP